MLVIVSYDIENNRKRARLAKKLRDFGPRVQKSVFEADIDDDEMERLLKMIDEIKLEKSESIRLYQACADCVRKIRYGVKERLQKTRIFILSEKPQLKYQSKTFKMKGGLHRKS